MAAPGVVDTTTAGNLIEQAAWVLRELYQAEQADTDLTPKRVTMAVNPCTGIVTYGFSCPVVVSDAADGGISFTPADYFPV